MIARQGFSCFYDTISLYVEHMRFILAVPIALSLRRGGQSVKNQFSELI